MSNLSHLFPLFFSTRGGMKYRRSRLLREAKSPISRIYSYSIQRCSGRKWDKSLLFFRNVLAFGCQEFNDTMNGECVRKLAPRDGIHHRYGPDKSNPTEVRNNTKHLNTKTIAATLRGITQTRRTREYNINQRNQPNSCFCPYLNYRYTHQFACSSSLNTNFYLR